MNIVQFLISTLRQPIDDYRKTNAYSAAYMNKDTESAKNLKTTSGFGLYEKSTTAIVPKNHELTSEKVVNADNFINALDQISKNEIKPEYAALVKHLESISKKAKEFHKEIWEIGTSKFNAPEKTYESYLKVIRDVFLKVSKSKKLCKLIVKSLKFGESISKQEDKDENISSLSSKKIKKNSDSDICSSKEQKFLHDTLSYIMQIYVDAERATHYKEAGVSYERKIPEANIDSTVKLLMDAAQLVVKNNEAQKDNKVRDQLVESVAGNLYRQVEEEYATIVAPSGLKTVASVTSTIFSFMPDIINDNAPVLIGQPSNKFLEDMKEYLN